MHLRQTVPAMLLSLFAAGCAAATTFPAQGGPLREADDTPIQFVTEEGEAGVTEGCRSPLVDPRDQTRIRMIRSGAVGATHQGDYVVPEGRYGVRTGELLRIDCTTGQALGIVSS